MSCVINFIVLYNCGGFIIQMYHFIIINNFGLNTQLNVNTLPREQAILHTLLVHVDKITLRPIPAKNHTKRSISIRIFEYRKTI